MLASNGIREKRCLMSATLYFCCSPGVSMLARKSRMSWQHMSAIMPVSLKLSIAAFCFFAICHFIRGFTLVNRFIGHSHVALSWRSLACIIYPSPNIIDLWLGNKIDRIIERRAVTRRMSMPMVKVAIHGNMNIPTVIQWSPKVLTAKACRTLQS